jgi:type I restriction enzyme R subunit
MRWRPPHSVSSGSTQLGDQTQKEFQKFVTPEEHRKFTELYNVQLLQSNKFDPVSKVTITTIQRLFSMLKGESEVIDPELEEKPLASLEKLLKSPVPVSYDRAIPIEYFDFVVIDECHRSIYNLWHQVLEYFDAFLIGITATPSKQTFGSFNQNLVMEYNHEQAVADGVNVGFDVYRIRTYISEHGSTVEAGLYSTNAIARRAKSVGNASTRIFPTARASSTATLSPRTKSARSSKKSPPSRLKSFSKP